MRVIENKKIKLPNVKAVWQNNQLVESTQVSEETTYFNLFKLASETAPKEGWNIAGASELKKRLELIDKFYPEKENITLEEAEYEQLKKLVSENISLRSTSIEVYDFYVYLNSIEKQKIEI